MQSIRADGTTIEVDGLADDVKFVLLKSKVRCISATLGAEVGLKHIRCWTHSIISIYCSGAI